jgi:hypothetical protein
MKTMKHPATERLFGLVFLVLVASIAHSQDVSVGHYPDGSPYAVTTLPNGKLYWCDEFGCSERIPEWQVRNPSNTLEKMNNSPLVRNDPAYQAALKENCSHKLFASAHPDACNTDPRVKVEAPKPTLPICADHTMDAFQRGTLTEKEINALHCRIPGEQEKKEAMAQQRERFAHAMLEVMTNLYPKATTVEVNGTITPSATLTSLDRSTWQGAIRSRMPSRSIQTPNRSGTNGR